MKVVGKLTPLGPLTLGDLRRLVANANLWGYSDAALVAVSTPIAGDRRRVTLTVTDDAPDALGDRPSDNEGEAHG